MSVHVMCVMASHKFVVVGATEDAPMHWRCKRCGKTRFSPPRGLAEGAEGEFVARDWGKSMY